MRIPKSLATAQRTKPSCFVAIVLLCCMAKGAEAKPAKCFTTDDGSYACEFRRTDADGSFKISAQGKPTYILNISEPGIAFGYVNLGQRNISLPGRYLRSKSEPGCWVNDITQAKICAR
jgi:hypothetical protein